LLGVPGFYSVGLLFAANVTGFPHVERLVVVWLVSWLGALCAAWLIHRLGASRKAGAYSAFICWFGIMSFGGIVRSLGTLPTLLILAGFVIVVGLLTHRASDWLAIDILIVATAVALVSGPLIAGLETARTYGESTLDAVDSPSIEMTRRPDIWLLVVDGYPSATTMEQDLMMPEGNRLTERLRGAGFDVPDSTWAPYATTQFVVPSILDMDYVASAWEENGATVHHLHKKISGENALLGVLADIGYETVMIESGWSGGACSGTFDQCIASPFYDEAINRVLHDSILSETPVSFLGLHFTLGAQSAMERLLELSTVSRPDDAPPRFIFAHLLVPHAPFFFDAACSVVLDEGRQGFFFPFPGVSGEMRDRYFLEQMSCVDDFVMRLEQSIGPEASIVLASDHGTDRRAQTTLEATDWTPEALRERFGTLAAFRAPYDCPLPDPLFSVNLVRVVLSCVSESELTNHSPRIFLGPGVELAPAEIEQLTD
jgi:hypothetical protein